MLPHIPTQYTCETFIVTSRTRRLPHIYHQMESWAPTTKSNVVRDEKNGNKRTAHNYLLKKNL